MSSTTKSRRSSRGSGKAGSSRQSRDFSAEADSMVADEVEAQVAAEEVAEEENNSSSQPPSTPAANASSRRSSMYEDTPTRVQRLHEKEELHDLNKRLEFYILKQRERDASADGWVREIDNIKNKAISDLQHQKELYENQLALARKTRDEHVYASLELKNQLTSKQQALDEAHIRIQSLEKFNQALESRNKELSTELLSVQTNLTATQGDLRTASHDLSTAQNNLAELDNKWNETRGLYETLLANFKNLSQKYEILQEEYNTLLKRHTDDTNKYQREIHTLCENANKTEEAVRKDYEKRLEQIFADRQSQAEIEKENALAELKRNFDDKLYGYRVQLEHTGHDLEQERINNRKLKSTLAEEQSKLTLLIHERDSLAEKVVKLEEALEREKANPELIRQIAEKQEIIKRIKAAFKRKDQEFDELMDVKIMLDLEIRAYRSMLEDEEARLGYMSPAKKRKRTSTYDNDQGAVIFNPQEAENTEGVAKSSALLFSGMDLEGQYVTVRNNSSSSVPLRGWSLRAESKGNVFTFPDVLLRAGESFTLRTQQLDREITGENENKQELYRHVGNEHIAVWEQENVWDEQGDVAQLISPEGQLAATVDVIPTAPNVEGAVGVTSSSSSSSSNKNDKNKCIIM